MNVRDQLLAAAARVYAEGGYHGATTRRIASAAGVNEITLFRHFGSKDALLREALAQCQGRGCRAAARGAGRSRRGAHRMEPGAARSTSRSGRRSSAPASPISPSIPSWSRRRSAAPAPAVSALAAYLGRLKQRRLVSAGFDERVAAAHADGRALRRRDRTRHRADRCIATDPSRRSGSTWRCSSDGIGVAARRAEGSAHEDRRSDRRAGRGAAPSVVGPIEPRGAAAKPLSLVEALEHRGARERDRSAWPESDLRRAEGERRRARSALLPSAHRLGLLYQRTLRSQFSALAGARTTGPAEPAPAGAAMPFVPRPGLPVERAARFAGGGGRVRQQRGSVRRTGRRPAVRAGEHLPVRPVVLADAVQRRTGQRPEPRRPTPAVRERRDRPHRGAGPAPARRHPGVLRRRAGRPPRRHRPGHPEAGRHHAEPDPARARSGQPVGVRSAARPGHPRQPAAGRDPAAARTATWRTTGSSSCSTCRSTSRSRSPPSWWTPRWSGPPGSPSWWRRRRTPATDARAPVRQANEAVTAQEGLLARCAGAALAPGRAHLGLRRVRLSQRRLAVRRPTTSPTGWWRWVFRSRSSPAGGSRATSRWPRPSSSRRRLRLQQTRELAQLDARSARLQLEAARRGLGGERRDRRAGGPRVPDRRDPLSRRASRPRPS